MANVFKNNGELDLDAIFETVFGFNPNTLQASSAKTTNNIQEENNIRDLTKATHFMAEGKIFIIPNAGMMPCNLQLTAQKEKFIQTAKQVCELNGMVFDEYQDILIETWFYSPDWHTDNLPDHGGELIDGNEKYTLGVDTRRYLPAKLFSGKREGDEVIIKLPGWFTKYRDGERCGGGDAILVLTLTLDQLNHRYARCGKWEEAMQRVITSAN